MANQMLVGVLVDVSGSMKEIYQLKNKPEDQTINRIQAVFSTIINIAQNEIDFDKSSRELFILAFGLETVNTCDLIALLDHIRTLKRKRDAVCYELGCGTDSRKSLIRLFEHNGISYVNKYVTERITEDDTKFVFEALAADDILLKQIIDMLPNMHKHRDADAYKPLIELFESKGALVADKYIKKCLTEKEAEFAYQILYEDRELLENIIGILPNRHKQHNYRARESLIQLFLDNGAPYTREYIQKYVTEDEAEFGFQVLLKDKQLLERIVAVLPRACTSYSMNLGISSTLPGFIESHYAKEIVDRAINMVSDALYAKHYDFIISRIASRTVSKFTEIIKNRIESRIMSTLQEMRNPTAKTDQYILSLLTELSNTPSLSNSASKKKIPISVDAIAKITKSIEPYIYGGTPMCEALRYALDAFEFSSQSWKILFLITDGQSADGDPSRFAKLFHDHSVYVCGCFLTADNILNPKRLYDTPDPNWKNPEHQLFELCSTVSNMHPGMSVLLDRDWELPASGQSRLFLQANHPDIVNEFSEVVRQMGENNDILLNIHSRVLLDIDINQLQSDLSPLEQEGETSYGCAVATVFHLAMRRIFERKDGFPSIEDIYKTVNSNKENGPTMTRKVIEKWCPFYRLKYVEVNEFDARRAINARRPSIATFRLTMDQFNDFSAFYTENPQGILEQKHLRVQDPSAKRYGHAVVLIECHPTHLRFMNWWGPHVPGGVFFNVRDQSVLNLHFYDIYWDLNDLTEHEKEAFLNKSNKSIQCFLQSLPKSVQNLHYECTECKQSSPMTEFRGTLREATCPKCNNVFKPVIKGIVEALSESEIETQENNN